MSAFRFAVLAGLVSLGGRAADAPAQLPAAPDRAAVKAIFDAWRAPVPPRHLLANIYYVGAIGVSSYLITTPEGHILLDTGFDDTVPIIRRSVEQLGFKLADIKIILSSHAHIDHVGGHALVNIPEASPGAFDQTHATYKFTSVRGAHASRVLASASRRSFRSPRRDAEDGLRDAGAPWKPWSATACNTSCFSAAQPSIRAHAW